MRKKTLFYFATCFICTATLFYSCKQQQVAPDAGAHTFSTVFRSLSVVGDTIPGYHLIWSDEFNSTGSFDTTRWQYCKRATSDWNRYLTSSPAYANLSGGNLNLKMNDSTIAGDTATYHSGGIQTATKFFFTYGKVEVRAKFNQGQGSWPGIWMLSETSSYGGWPNSGEVDIMEHINSGSIVYQTIHTGSGSPGNTAPYTASNYNLYDIIWSPSSIQFYVNNVLYGTYTKPNNATSSQWPFNEPFYIILDQAGGGSWTGAINNAALPFSMQVDYVRVYKANLLSNPGFESGAASPWAFGSTTSIITSNVNTGKYAVLEQGTTATSAEQTVTNLLPNTTYTFGGYGKVGAAGQSVSIGVKNYGGSQVSDVVTSTTYQNGSVTFTTGATNTQATVFFYKPNSGTAYGDDFYLTQ